MITLEKVVAKLMLQYHSSCISVTNALGMLHLIKDETWELRNRNHFMQIVTEVWPHLGVGSGDFMKDLKMVKERERQKGS